MEQTYNEFCRTINGGEPCKYYIKWSFGYGDCESCELVGESRDIERYPEDCPFKEKIKDYQCQKQMNCSTIKNTIEVISLDAYQAEALKTSVVSDMKTLGVREYCTMGLTEEAGEVAGKMKKLHRDDNGVMTEERREAIAYELGDVLWYVAVMADSLGYPLDIIANMNVQKLRSRMERNKLHGDGDNR